MKVSINAREVGPLWLREELARFTYRPGWCLSVELEVPTATSAPVVLVEYRTADSYHPEREMPIVARRQIPEFLELAPQDRRSDEFARWLQRFLWDIERHESQEWLRRDGQIFDDPHEPRAEQT